MKTWMKITGEQLFFVFLLWSDGKATFPLRSPYFHHFKYTSVRSHEAWRPVPSDPRPEGQSFRVTGAKNIKTSLWFHTGRKEAPLLRRLTDPRSQMAGK